MKLDQFVRKVQFPSFVHLGWIRVLQEPVHPMVGAQLDQPKILQANNIDTVIF